MKKAVILMFSSLVPLVLLFLWQPQHFAHGEATAVEANKLSRTLPQTTPPGRADLPAVSLEAEEAPLQKQIISYAMSLLGSPYVYAGMSRDGFDCSGFTTHVFANHDIAIPHSSRLQAEEGRPVPRESSRPGDLVIFTGTNPEVREPGHVGIVISQPGDTIEFVHSSSNGGVKVSQVEGTGYDVRFMEVRRVL